MTRPLGTDTTSLDQGITGGHLTPQNLNQKRAQINEEERSIRAEARNKGDNKGRDRVAKEKETAKKQGSIRAETGEQKRSR